MANFDVEAYYAEQDEHMNLPDEDTDEFIKRVSSLRQRCVHHSTFGIQSECPDKALYSEMFNAPLETSHALDTSAGSKDRAPRDDQATVSEVMMALYQVNQTT